MDFLWLIGAHFVGDIALQSSWQADNKGKYWYVMLSHCIIWTMCICLVLGALDTLEWWHPFFLVGFHAIADVLKTRIPKTPENWKYIYPDQIWHLCQLLVVYYVC
jgi:hypothetical protein